MAKLILKFEDKVLRETSIGTQPVIIGRGTDADIQIDNLAVSTHHARVFVEEGRLVVEDQNSLNGTFVNNQKVQRQVLKHGDSILIGKHHLVVHDTWEAGPAAAPAEAPKKVVAPKIQETMVLDSKKRAELLQQALAAKQAAQQPAQAPTAPGAPSATGTQIPAPAAPPRARVGALVVLEGRTDQREYTLSGKLTVVGKSEMATVKLKGWFKPKIACQINKRDDGYYLARADKVPSVNGQPISGATKLSDGDIIEVAGVRLNFTYPD